ncbi:hypothetical protein KUTeg_008157 [Tegillarca granosa]|uniref:Uncharacterized protein n=1 Tax=Tegillarca granosa TaxID=220873 RepID=A0ABQ9F8C3_TEGGR|nr:hypothetical protein KUTeg_008157 [Tegillarca granosa]
MYYKENTNILVWRIKLIVTPIGTLLFLNPSTRPSCHVTSEHVTSEHVTPEHVTPEEFYKTDKVKQDVRSDTESEIETDEDMPPLTGHGDHVVKNGRDKRNQELFVSMVTYQTL